MKESISYTFLLNIVILFIFVCFAIVMGVFSYYRAFKANTIIVSAIEKYEGYNCLSAQEAAIKLNGISYNVPFDVKCKGNYGTPCMVDSNADYAVVSYNLDYNSGVYKAVDDYSDMNSSYTCSGINECENTKKYQYGVYTYMYVDFPIVSNIIRIPFFSKTEQLHEFRNFAKSNTENSKQEVYDVNFIPSSWINDSYNNDADAVGLSYNNYFAKTLLSEATNAAILSDTPYERQLELEAKGYDYFATNERAIIQLFSVQPINALNGYNLKCGYEIDYRK